MRKGKSEIAGPAERRRERARGNLASRRTTGRIGGNAAATAIKRAGVDPIGFLCDVLSNESASDHERREAAEELLPYYHAKLATMGPLLKRFLCEQRR
jgi:hypothetical protein